MRRVLGRVGLLQLDSVNVVVRAHYLPLFSRLGPYPAELIDDLAYRRRKLVECWAHVASLVPTEHYPLFRHRMDTQPMWRSLRQTEAEHPGYVEAVYAEVERHGPLSIGDLEDGGPRTGPWWGYGKGKLALEWLFMSGRLAIADRRNFTRYYDLTERVIPAEVLAAPAPDEAAAHRELVRFAVRRLGIGAVDDIADYYRLGVRSAQPVLDELTAAGEVEPVRVAGLDKLHYLDHAARRPRRLRARALLSPFDPVVWHRARAERLYGFHYRIEIYVPAPDRRYGYYVMPFLLDEDLVARVDLKADRAAGVLRVPGAFLEDGRDRARVARELAAELRSMADWLRLDAVAVGRKGDLAGPLRAEI